VFTGDFIEPQMSDQSGNRFEGMLFEIRRVFWTMQYSSKYTFENSSTMAAFGGSVRRLNHQIEAGVANGS